MGEGVAMRHRWFVIPLALGLAGLAGCSSDGNRREHPVLLALDALKQRMDEHGAAPPPALTRDMIEPIQVPLYLARLESRGAQGLLFPIGENGADVTWVTADHITVIIRDGVIRATRGLGEDLMSASTPDSAEIAAAAGVTQREYYHIGPDEQTIRRKYTCDLHDLGAEDIVLLGQHYNAHHISESCHGAGQSFVNEYWFDAGGQMRKSVQWVSQTVGFLELQKLKD